MGGRRRTMSQRCYSMKIEIWLIDSKDPGKKQKADLDFPSIPRKGECIIIDETENYEVREVVYRLDKELRFTGRITVDAYSLWNTK